MGISDLFVSYNQVQAPSYLESPQIEYTPIGEELTTQENLDRIQSRNQKKEGFAGWNPLEQNTSEDNSTNTSHTPAKGSKSFHLAMASYLAKHPEDAQYRQTLTKIAEKESSFRPTVTSKYSSACGYFGFINSTRKQYAPNLTREQFLNNPEEQIAAAARLLKANRKTSSKFANLRGLSQLQVDYGMWFSPGEFAKYLKTGKSDFKDAQGTSLMTILKKMA